MRILTVVLISAMAAGCTLYESSDPQTQVPPMTGGPLGRTFVISRSLNTSLPPPCSDFIELLTTRTVSVVAAGSVLVDTKPVRMPITRAEPAREGSAPPNVGGTYDELWESAATSSTVSLELTFELFVDGAMVTGTAHTPQPFFNPDDGTACSVSFRLSG